MNCAHSIDGQADDFRRELSEATRYLTGFARLEAAHRLYERVLRDTPHHHLDEVHDALLTAMFESEIVRIDRDHRPWTPIV